MSIVDVKVNAKYYQDLAKKAIENNDISIALRHYRAALSLDNLTKDEIYTLKKEYAKALALRGKFSFSNKMIYEVLVDRPHDSEAYAILMYNFKAVDYDEAAKYYSKKAQPFLNKRRDDFKKYLSDLNQDFLYYDDMEIPVKELNNDEFDRLISGEFPFIDDIKDKPKPTFTVLDHIQEFDTLMNKLYDAARHEDYAKAIDYANDAIRLNVADDVKIAAIYAKSVALMMMGYARESLDQVNVMLARHPDDNSFILLKAEILQGMKDDDGLVRTLKVFNDRPKDEVLPFERIIDLYLKRGLYGAALEFVEPRLPYFIDSYTLLSYYGVILFDIGRVKEAKSVFADLNGIYGDLCDARHLQNYIKLGIDKPMLVIPQFGDIKELTERYVNELCLLLEQNDNYGLTYLNRDVDDFISKLTWVIEGGKLELAEAVIKQVFLLAIGKGSNKKGAKQALKIIYNMPATIDGLPKDIKESIFELRLLEEKPFCYLDSWNLFKISKDVFKGFSVSKTIYFACVHAVAYDMARDSERYYKTLKVCKLIDEKYKVKNFAWKSKRNIYALIVYLSGDRENMPEGIVPDIIYDKKLFQKYLAEFDSVEI